ncbi:MAG: VanZ family protein [Trichlorobacter sp.]|nr:VanZ family protein [Trichlorobacter sp.]
MLQPVRIFWFLLLIILTITLLYLSLASTPVGGSGLGWDKANHAVAMFAVTMVTWLTARPAKLEIAKAAVYAFFLGFLIELLQAFLTKSRSAEWADLLADTVGIIIAVSVIFLYRQITSPDNNLDKKICCCEQD